MFTGLVIRDLVTRIRKLSLYLGMEFDEVLEWIRADNNKIAPWEE